MSILPHRTSPRPLTTGEQRSRRLDGLPSRMRHAPNLSWRVHWRAILPATTPGKAHATARLEAFLSSEGIELTLRDQHGAVLGQRWLDAVASSVQTNTHLLLEWARPEESPTDRGPSSDLMMVRVLLEEGRKPLVRTMLPESMGLPGGRYDLVEATPLTRPSTAEVS